MQRKHLFTLLALALALAALTAARGQLAPLGSYLRARMTGFSDKPAQEIVLWHCWGGTQKEYLERVVSKFEEAHPGMNVKTVFIGTSLSNSQKFFTAVAARKAPDVVFVDGPQVSEFACQGALQPLDARVKTSRIKPGDFFNPCWKQCNYGGHTWAMTYCVDPNFSFAWNKDSFRKAGIDPNKPPESIAELDIISDKLTVMKGNRIDAMGIVPWAQFGAHNSMFTWGWVFGGSFYDEKRHRITANDPNNVRALEWMCSYAKRYGANRIAGLQQGFGALDKYPLYTGQLAMGCFHISQVQDARTYAAGLDYGLGYIPCPPGGERQSSWIGGWCMGLPSRSAHPDQGWELIRWLCADPKGTSIVGGTQDLFPGYRKSLYFEKVKNNPRYGVFLKILKSCKHQRPVMPAQLFYMGALERAVDLAIYGQKTPKQALDDATVETQRELDLRLAGR
ncbi:MAG: ABC transporter substrate-binding protein [Armatimonadetes bacterium]|nr:ABC transporter substrate-binding protein [Armatimonadota bacterium]